MLPRKISSHDLNVSDNEMSDDESIVEVRLHRSSNPNSELYMNPTHFSLERAQHSPLSISIPSTPSSSSPYSSGSEPAITNCTPEMQRQSATPTQSMAFAELCDGAADMSSDLFSPLAPPPSPYNTPTLEGVTTIFSTPLQNAAARNAFQRLFPSAARQFQPESNAQSLERVLGFCQSTLKTKLTQLALSDLTLQHLKQLQNKVGERQGIALKEAIAEQSRFINCLSWASYLPNAVLTFPLIPMVWKAPFGLMTLLFSYQMNKYCFQAYSKDLELLEKISEHQLSLFEKIQKAAASSIMHDIENPAIEEEEQMGLLRSSR